MTWINDIWSAFVRLLNWLVTANVADAIYSPRGVAWTYRIGNTIGNLLLIASAVYLTAKLIWVIWEIAGKPLWNRIGTRWWRR